MIKNIVFDLGGVLIDFNPKCYLEHIGIPEEEIPYYIKTVFYGYEWGIYNTGKYDSTTLKNALIDKYPENESTISKILDEIDYSYILFDFKEVVEYLKGLKSEGYNIYILSDLSKDSFEYNKSFDFFKYVSGGIYSFEIGSIKPNDNNYKQLLETYNLVPDETIFIDDRPQNVEAANKFGIHGIQFTTLDEVKEKVNELKSANI